MSKKSIRDFSELQTFMKKTETEAEVKGLLKGEFGGHRHKPKPILPVSPTKRVTRNLSATDHFIIDTLKIPLADLSPDQLQNARDTIREAMTCAQDSMQSIKRQLESVASNDDTWKRRAETALRFKVVEGQELQKRMLKIDELIAQAKPPLKLVVTPPPVVAKPPAPPPVAAKPPPPPVAVKPPPQVIVTPAPSPAGAYEIRSNAPRPNVHHSDEWRKYPFEKLGIGHSFRFGTETADQVRRFISAAQRHLGRHFSYRKEPDGVIAVWRVEGPSPSKRRR
jgi:hypothetical protein